MVNQSWTRRRLCLALATLASAPANAARADGIVELEWKDLRPVGQTALPPSLQGLVPHDEAALASSQPVSSGVRTDWNGSTVRLSGFIIPLEYEGTGVSAFMLVPYVGACIHVPPPPANQLVLVTAKRPYDSGNMFEAVTVTGKFSTASTKTQLAEVGYAMLANRITKFRG